jgi:hypothetical protein
MVLWHCLKKTLQGFDRVKALTLPTLSIIAAKPQQIHQDMTHHIAPLATFRWDQVGALGLAFRVECPAFGIVI